MEQQIEIPQTLKYSGKLFNTYSKTPGTAESNPVTLAIGISSGIAGLVILGIFAHFIRKCVNKPSTANTLDAPGMTELNQRYRFYTSNR